MAVFCNDVVESVDMLACSAEFASDGDRGWWLMRVDVGRLMSDLMTAKQHRSQKWHVAPGAQMAVAEGKIVRGAV